MAIQQRDVASDAVTNPIYTGVGPFPQLVSRDQWIDAVDALIQQRGARPVLRMILDNLRAAFPADE